MAIATGLYIIVNAWQNKQAYLRTTQNNLAANSQQNDAYEQWNVQDLGNGIYTIKNAGTNTFATAGRDQENAIVEGQSSSHQWTIKETPIKGLFSIATTSTGLFWGLVDGSSGTPIALASTVSDGRNCWVFKLTSPRAVPRPAAAPAPAHVPAPGFYNPGGGPQFGPDVPIPTWR
ncbi:hypothetical protein GALMADRAFT_216819 [Galerina marginata CBS 339.88]|uniref:Ricin B lectin domain-containing protein n=1 Tax=Galerina marginata (strain CBS 339.88) TaxID=685588 RepID=A0A067SIW2_GALM3|nr:hypothetical protein GALMADRAFT_216819 [Galerina marginata CBS 339.88]